MENNIYIVEHGDTLYGIAKRFNTDLTALAHFNGIEDPDRITPGQIIRIPPYKDGECVPIYIIKSGDTLYKLAKEFGISVEALAKANNISDTDKIEAGRILRLPDEAKKNCYRVQKGDSLWAIAKKCGVTVTDLINENRLISPSQIYPGQLLRIPLKKR